MHTNVSTDQVPNVEEAFVDTELTGSIQRRTMKPIEKVLNVLEKEDDDDRRRRENSSSEETIVPGTTSNNKHSSIRMRCRSWLLRKVREEEEWIIRIQNSWNSTCLVYYFTACGILGSQQFFTVILPSCHWLGLSRLSRLLTLLCALGLYVSNFLKDFFGLPRPGTRDTSDEVSGERQATIRQTSIDIQHRLEYGFPSAHSAAALSMPFFILSSLFSQGVLANSLMNRIVGYTMAVFYSLNVSFSRIYTGMHSLTDVVGGLCIGGAVMFFVIMVGDYYDHWVVQYGSATLIVNLVGLCLLYVHPSPAEACPCFYDSVSFVAVVGGVALATYHYARSPWALSIPFPATLITPFSFRLWHFHIIARLIIGILIILAWIVIINAFLKMLLARIDDKWKLSLWAQKRTSSSIQPTEFKRLDPRYIRAYIVYFGVGWLAIYGCPAVFSFLGI